MILRVVFDFDLDNLPVDDVWSVLRDLADGVGCFVTHCHIDLNVDKSASVDVSCLQESGFDGHDIEVAESLEMVPVVAR